MKKIVLFGGTFDPPHIGHDNIINVVKDQIDPNMIILVPTYNPPLKLNKPFAKFKHRLNMLNAIYTDDFCVYLSNFESKDKKHISYTYKTIKYFHKRYKKDQLYFVVGQDRYNDFYQWKKWKYILKHAILIVIKREESFVDELHIPNTIFLNVTPIKISSTELRNKPDPNFLNKNTVKYIADNFLYAEQQVKNILSEERFKHTLRVADYAIKLCKAQNYFMVKETYAAALYHDICKEMSDDIILNLVGKNYDKTKFPTTHTLHGLAAAQYIQKNFNITNENVINAVANHVIPSNKSTILDAIIYCADKLEPERTTEDVPNRIIYEKIIKQDLMYVFNKLVNETKKKFEKC